MALFIGWAAAGPAAAIPVFARRYHTACTTCHVQPPLLNSYGAAFRANGYRLPAGEPARQEKDVQLGAPEWDALFPNSFPSGTLPDAAPIAGLVYAALATSRGAVTTEDSVLVFALLSGGNLGQHASWFAKGGFAAGGAGLQRFHVSFDHLGSDWLSVRAGFFEPGLVPFSRYTHGLSYQGYLPFEAGGPAGLALSDSHTAIEAYGAGSDPGPLRGLQYAIGLAGRSAAGGLASDGYARASYKFGGIAPGGDRGGEPAGSVPAIAPRDETSLRLGAFAYRATLRGPDSRPRGWRAGGDLELVDGRWQLFATAWAGGDSVAAAATEAASWAYLGGGSVRPWPWLLLLARYEAEWMAGAPAQRRLVGTVRAALQQNLAASFDLVVEMPGASSNESIASLFLAF